MSFNIKLTGVDFNNPNLPVIIPTTPEGFVTRGMFGVYDFKNGNLASTYGIGPTITAVGTTSQPYGIELNGAGDSLNVASKPTGTCTYMILVRNRSVAAISTDTILSDSASLGAGMRLFYRDDTELGGWQYNTVNNQPQPGVSMTVNTDWDVLALRVNYTTLECSISVLNDGTSNTTTATSEFVQNSDILKIGASNGAGNDLFGSVSMFLMYDVYLSDSELIANYNAIKENQPPEIPPLP